MTEIDSETAVTLLASMGVSILIRVSEQLPPHSRQGREVKKLEAAIVSLSRLHSTPLDEKLVEVGVKMWNAAVKTMQKELKAL